MAALLTPQTLAKWTQSDEAEVVTDPFAADLIDKLSALVCFIGGHDGTKYDDLGDVIPEWSLVADTPVGAVVAPIDVQMVMLQVAKRSYQNPDEILQDGSTGPLGGDRYSDVHALFMDFTDSERATLAKYNADGDPTPQDGSGVVFTIQTTRGDETILPQTSPLYIGDNLQTGLAESVDPREWMIPLFNPGDPGGDENYL